MNPYDLKLAQAAYDAAQQRHLCMQSTLEYFRVLAKEASLAMQARYRELHDLKQLRMF